MKLFFLLAVLSLAGCATPQVISSGERSVTVRAAMEAWAKTQPLAAAECAKFGRKAAFKYNTEGFPGNYFYDCVL